MSGHEMLDQEFSSDAMSDHPGRAPPIEVQFMDIDSEERDRRGRDEASFDHFSSGLRRKNGAYNRRNFSRF